MTSDHAVRITLGLLQVALAPLLLGCWLERRRGAGERWFCACAELLSLVPGRPGSTLRKAFYRATLRACATRAYVSFGALLVHRDAAIGRNVYIGPYSIVGSATIGDDVKIASRVSITSGRRQHDVGAAGPVAATPRFSEISIGAGSWIGEGAVVMANVGRNSIVGAGSVVVRHVPDGTTVVGNPAHEVASMDRLRERPGTAAQREEGGRTWPR
jgi:virginiamycin A acetyltransferase